MVGPPCHRVAMRELGDLVVDVSARGDRATAVYRALLDAVRSGRLEPGERLPPTRALAVDLGVSRTTVATAYDRLVAEGFLTARVGAGTFVADAARPVRAPRRGTDLAPRPGWDLQPHPTSGSDAQAAARLPGRHPRRAAVPVRHLAAPGDRGAARGRPRPRGLRRPGRLPAAARGDLPPARALARRDGHLRRGAGHLRHPAGPRPGHPGARRPGRRGGGRGARLPAGPRRLRVLRRARGAGPGRPRGPGRRRAAGHDPARLHDAVPPVPDRPAALARAEAGAARLRGPAPVCGDRGRLRQRVPVHRAAARDAALDGRRGPGPLPRHLLQVAGARGCGSATWWHPSRSRTRCGPRSS